MPDGGNNQTAVCGWCKKPALVTVVVRRQRESFCGSCYGDYLNVDRYPKIQCPHGNDSNDDCLDCDLETAGGADGPLLEE